MTNTHFTMPKVQVVVANAAMARFFTVESPTGELIELEQENNPEARMHEGDLMDDKRGRLYDRGSQGESLVSRSGVDETTDPKEVKIESFARELAERLDKERTQGKVERIYLAASPSFLGELRKHMSNQLKPLIVEEIAKDFTGKNTRELRKHLPEYLK